jgi:SAM-dependent methyltransferase
MGRTQEVKVRNVTDPSQAKRDLPLSQLEPEEKTRRASSFGGVASHYERYRPGPPAAAVDWLLPERVERVVDLGAGTGALSRLLVDRADEVVAVEPDDRMRAVLANEVPGVTAVAGRGESMPIPAGWADAVVASSSWHWMDPVPALHEVARVLVPHGILGALWSGPDPEGPFLVQAQALLAGSEIGGMMLGEAERPLPTLEIPPGVPFTQPEREAVTWDVALTADDLIGLLGTLSWIITMPEERRERIFAEARRLLRDLLGIEGDRTVDVAFRADIWRARRHV